VFRNSLYSTKIYQAQINLKQGSLSGFEPRICSAVIGDTDGLVNTVMNNGVTLKVGSL
jgi:hypothetical protein